MLVFGASPSILRARLTMPPAVNLGSLEFTSLVPAWIMIFSGSFLRMGLIKSSMSSVLAPGNGFTTTLLVLERLQPRMFWMIESPAITVTAFLVCALFPGPDCGSFSFFSGFLSLVLVFSFFFLAPTTCHSFLSGRAMGREHLYTLYTPIYPVYPCLPEVILYTCMPSYILFTHVYPSNTVYPVYPYYPVYPCLP